MVSTLELGALVGDKYRIVRPIGAGAMGAVFEAEHLVTGKRCAIKRLHRQPGAHEAERRRAIHEARAACRIHHENVVDVYDVLEQDGAIYLVMELLSGEPLSALLARETPAPDVLIGLLLPAMRGMIAVHEAGVVHRDVKPENIFLADEPGHRDKVAKIIDFGVSKVSDAQAAAHHSGMTLGTPRYMSYEQLVGRDVDARTDVYAFGAILYEALTGRAPYGDAQSLGDLGVRMATTEPEPPHALQPALPEALSALVMRAIARDVAQRIPSMSALVAELGPFAAPDSGEPETRATVRPRAPRRSLPTRARWTMPSLAALAAFAALVTFALLREPAPPNASPVSPAPAAAPPPSALPETARPLAPPPSMAESDHALAAAPTEEPTVDAAAAPSTPAATRALRRRAASPTRTEAQDAGLTPAQADERHRAGQLRRVEF